MPLLWWLKARIDTKADTESVELNAGNNTLTGSHISHLTKIW